MLGPEQGTRDRRYTAPGHTQHGASQSQTEPQTAARSLRRALACSLSHARSLTRVVARRWSRRAACRLRRAVGKDAGKPSPGAPAQSPRPGVLLTSLEAVLQGCQPVMAACSELLLAHARCPVKGPVRSLFFTGLAGAFLAQSAPANRAPSTHPPPLVHTGSGKTTEIARIALMLLGEYTAQGFNPDSADFRQPFPLQVAGSVGTAAANLGAPTLHGLLGWRPLPSNLVDVCSHGEACFPEWRVVP